MDSHSTPADRPLSPFAEGLHIGNSLSREKERFAPYNPPYVGMYVCGPTVYSNVHLGNVRTFLTFDIVYRYLLHLGFKVRYVRNITDVDNRTLQALQHCACDQRQEEERRADTRGQGRAD